MLMGLPGLSRAEVDVIGDDDRDAFIGSGSLLLPSQMYSQGRDEASDCPGCSWRAVVQCEMNSAGSCRGPARLCGPEGSWLRIYLTRPDGVEIDLGAACFGDSGPLRRDTAEAQIREIVRETIPPLGIATDPPAGVLPHLPVAFRTGQASGSATSLHSVIGQPLTLTVTPQWTWDFGDGVRETTRSSGGRWPDLSVGHKYNRSGDHLVRVASRWEATYVIDGLGPLTVAEAVTQEADRAVLVGEARAILVR